MWRLSKAMRYAVRCSSCALLCLFTTTLVAQETKAPWWKFGRSQEAAPTAQATVTPAPTLTPAPETITPVEEDSWLAWPSMPQWHWPEFAASSETTVSNTPANSTPAVTNYHPRVTRSHFG